MLLPCKIVDKYAYVFATTHRSAKKFSEAGLFWRALGSLARQSKLCMLGDKSFRPGWSWQCIHRYAS